MNPAEQVAHYIGLVYQSGLTTTSGGNISVKDKNGDIWITPSAVDKGTLTQADIMCVKHNGAILGIHNPSSEYPFHRAIYDNRPDITAIVHAHPPALVAFSIVRQVPDTRVVAHARNVCGTTGYAAYELPGSDKLGRMIAEVFRKGPMEVVMENHGIVVGGTCIEDAFQRFETLEFCARTILYGKALGEVSYLSTEQLNEYNQSEPLPELDKVTFPPDESEKRSEICRMVHRACRQGLMISTYGTVSVKGKEEGFLITPSGISRRSLEE